MTARRPSKSVTRAQERYETMQKQIAYHLDEIRKLHKADAKLTLLVRHPARGDGFCALFGSDDFRQAAYAILRMVRYPEGRGYVSSLGMEESK